MNARTPSDTKRAVRIIRFLLKGTIHGRGRANPAVRNKVRVPASIRSPSTYCNCPVPNAVQDWTGRYTGRRPMPSCPSAAVALALMVLGTVPAGGLQSDEALIYATVVGANGNPIPR